MEAYLIPTYVLPLLWLDATGLAVVAFFAQKQNPDYALPYTLSLAAATAFLGAGIALWVYSFINRQAQDRQFGHEIEVRWFENIYAGRVGLDAGTRRNRRRCDA